MSPPPKYLIYRPFAMRLEIELGSILFPMIILEMFLQLHWSPPVVKSRPPGQTEQSGEKGLGQGVTENLMVTLTELQSSSVEM